MKKTISSIACLLAVLMIIAPISILSFAGGAQKIIINALDFSDLPISDSAYYQKKCELNTNSDIFKLGIMLDSAESIGIGTDKTNFKGFYARDNDSDGITDILTAVSYNNKGMRFTLGVDLENDWLDAEAVVLHIDNSVNSWSLWQSFDIKLISGSGENYSLKSKGDASDITAMFIDDVELNVTNRNIGQNEYAFMPGNKSGYVVIPISAFEDASDLSDIVAISFNISSKASIFTSFKEIGFTTDVTSLLGSLVGGSPRNIELEAPVGGSAVIKVDGNTVNTAVAGSTVEIEATADSGYVLGAVSVTSIDGSVNVETNGLTFVMPDFDVKVSLIFDKSSSAAIPQRVYSKLVDLSVITPGDYRAYTWDCILDTSTELFTKGVIVQNEPLGCGDDSNNYHGFWAVDTDGDTVTDKLKSHPHCDKGMRFTFGFNNLSALPENREALLIKLDNLEIDGSSWGKNTKQELNLTLRDAKGNTYPFKEAAETGDSIIKIINPADFSVTEFSPNTEGNYCLVPTEITCWIVIPLELFDGLNGNEKLTALSFELSSTWNAYTSFYEVGITDNASEVIDFLTGKAKRYRIETNPAENGAFSTDLSLAREGTTVAINTAPDEGYILDNVTVHEKLSGKALPHTKTSFVMPACDVVVSATFKPSPYNSAARLDEIYTVTQDFSTVEIVDHIDWIDGPDLTPLIEQGALIEDLDRGFKDQGVVNCYNGNGIYIQDDGLGFGTSLKLWTHDNTGLSISLKSNDVLPDTEYEGVVLHLHTDLMRSEAIPALSVTLYKKGADGKPDLLNPIKPKAASALYGTTVWLVNDETGEITERQLGYSPEEGANMSNDQKNFSQYLVPDGFSGYVLIPYGYFAKSFEASEIIGIRLNYNVSDWYMYSSIYDVGFTQSISNFVRIASLGNYNEVQLVENLYNVEADIFETYKGTEKSLKITVLKDYLMYYMWSMTGLDIKKIIPFDTTVFFGNGSEKGIDKFYSDATDSVYLEIPQEEFPGKIKLTLDVSWDFYDGTHLNLYSYNPSTGAMTDTGATAIVDAGFVSFDFTKGGKYLLAMRSLTPITVDTQENQSSDAPDTVTNTIATHETTGHYETISGNKKYKNVKTMQFIGYETWFIVLIIVAVVFFLAAAAVAAIILIKRKRRRKNA